MRRNHIEISVKGLILAVVVVIACILSAIALYMVNRGKSTINNGNNQYSALMSDFTELDKTMYDGLEVSGDDVINVIDMLKGDSTVAVGVYTLLNSVTGKEYSVSGYTVPEKSSDDYINPSATFKGKITKNSNGIVVRIDFTQQ